nr:PAZ domain-containing protein [Tanacetum cinerariifolium]
MSGRARGGRAPPSGPTGGRGRGRGSPHPQSSPSSSSTVRQFENLAITPAQAPMQAAVVETPAPSVAPSSSKKMKAPARPGFGTVGRKCVINANHFLVEIGNKDPYQYDVAISPEVTSKTKCRDIMKYLTDSYRASHLGNLMLAYDGKKSAFVAGPLPFESKEFVVKITEQNGREREFKVSIKFAAKKDLHHLRQFLHGRQQDHPQETIQALDVVLRESASKGREIIGRSLFSPEMGIGPLGDGIEFWKGFYQSLRPTQMGLSLNIDMSARAFYEEKLVSDFVGEFLGRDISRPLSDQDLPPAYYAHLAAFRARYYMEGDLSDSDSRGGGGRNTRDRVSNVRPLPVIKENVKSVMFYC